MEAGRELNISVDRSMLLKAEAETNPDRKPGLTGILQDVVANDGPMTVAEYMLYALQHPMHGYYMQPAHKIGRQGDFITAPEISQVTN